MTTLHLNNNTERREKAIKEATVALNGGGQIPEALLELAYALTSLGELNLALQITNLARAKLIKEAIAILDGNGSKPDQILKLAKRLAGLKEIGFARRILARACKDLKKSDYPKIYLGLFQKWALYTYKDPDLPASWRLDRALEILSTPEDLSTTKNQESLGITGAIYKRKWEIEGQRNQLERSLLFYLKGYAQGAGTEEGKSDIIGYLRRTPTASLNADDDRGYNGINAAFMLDLLAQQEEAEAQKAGLPSETAGKRREDARRIREEIIRSVPPLITNQKNKWLEGEWWFYATIGEAYFGLERYEDALNWLVNKPREAKLLVPEWEYESTARQLTKLTLLKHNTSISEADFENSEAGRALKTFLGHDERAVRSAFRGKFGLALSGGGFRASLYHIGVLSKLAELDLLRHVEVLSCVSGGSIIGAYYYLELRNLLQRKIDDEIDHEDYIRIIKRIEEQFVKGVQRNIRTRVLAEFSTNLKMVFWPAYSRTKRVGELYESEIFSRIKNEDIDEKSSRKRPNKIMRLFRKREPLWLNDLYIKPRINANELQETFSPRNHNWRRKNKVPILLLNATSLNTGHIWQFTASYMGEPPGPISRELDSNYRLRRMYYCDAPTQYQKFRLGYAVAASSCVPALFEPLILNGLYPNISVRLVDGGVCDNQGTTGLLEQDCTTLMVSDGSGQMESENLPRNGILGLGVLSRANEITMARVRETQYTDVSARKRLLLLRGLMFVHLKQDLTAGALAWEKCPANRKISDFEQKINPPKDKTCYNIQMDIQKQLAAIRTDLDSFTEAEAYALMLSGYRMTGYQLEFEKCIDGIELPASSTNWKFLAIESSMTDANEKKEHLKILLNASSSMAFKVWKQSLALKTLKWVLLVALVGLVCWFFYDRWNSNILTQENLDWLRKHLTFASIGKAMLKAVGFILLSVIITALIGKAMGKNVMKLIKWRSTIVYIGIGVFMCLFGWWVARLHLHFFDKLYLRYGKLRNFPKGNADNY
jgi:predicted acylesterase/phospholipase RssA